MRGLSRRAGEGVVSIIHDKKQKDRFDGEILTKI